MRVTQAFRREGTNAARFAGLSDEFRVSRLRAQKYIATYFPFVQFLADIAGLLVLAAGASRVHSGELTAGALIAYLLYIDMVFSPVQQLSQVFDGYQQAAVGLRRIGDLLRTVPSTPEPARPVPVPAELGEIVFDDVTFAYGPDTRPALEGVSVRIPGRADGGAGRADRRGQVDLREDGRPLLRPDRRRGHGRRPRPARVRADGLAAPARRGPAGGVPVRRDRRRGHRLRAVRTPRRARSRRRPARSAPRR